MLVGHGVDPALYDDMHDRVIELFTSTPLAEKMRFRAERFGSVNQGYFPIEETSEIHPDLVEGWVWCRRAFDIPQQREGAVQGRGFLAESGLRAAIPPPRPRPRGFVQADRPGDAPGPRLRSPFVSDDKLTGDEFRAAAQLLSADDRGAGGPGPGGCSATKTSTCSPSFRQARSMACRSGTIAAASGCG